MAGRYIITNKKKTRTKSNVALTNISRETKYFHDFQCAVYKIKVNHSPFLRIGYVLSTFYVLKMWGIFQPHIVIKKCAYKKKECTR